MRLIYLILDSTKTNLLPEYTLLLLLALFVWAFWVFSLRMHHVGQRFTTRGSVANLAASQTLLQSLFVH
jgi:hypothetical protein